MENSTNLTSTNLSNLLNNLDDITKTNETIISDIMDYKTELDTLIKKSFNEFEGLSPDEIDEKLNVLYNEVMETEKLKEQEKYTITPTPVSTPTDVPTDVSTIALSSGNVNYISTIEDEKHTMEEQVKLLDDTFDTLEETIQNITSLQTSNARNIDTVNITSIAEEGEYPQYWEQLEEQSKILGELNQKFISLEGAIQNITSLKSSNSSQSSSTIDLEDLETESEDENDLDEEYIPKPSNKQDEILKMMEKMGMSELFKKLPDNFGKMEDIEKTMKQMTEKLGEQFGMENMNMNFDMADMGGMFKIFDNIIPKEDDDLNSFLVEKNETIDSDIDCLETDTEEELEGEGEGEGEGEDNQDNQDKQDKQTLPELPENFIKDNLSMFENILQMMNNFPKDKRE
jgi:hypothetical protein